MACRQRRREGRQGGGSGGSEESGGIGAERRRGRARKEGIGNVESGREGVSNQVRETEADGAALLCGEDERGSVPLGACWRRIIVG
jgi:hypothetical protein